MIEADAVAAALGALRHTDPPALDDKLFTGWLTAPSRIGAVFVAFTPLGVQFVRSSDAFDSDPGAFAQAYRQRFARPLRPADRAPAGLLPVLSGRRGPTPPLDLSGLSEFERNVLAATRTIPTGETRPYGWVASEATPTIRPTACASSSTSPSVVWPNHSRTRRPRSWPSIASTISFGCWSIETSPTAVIRTMRASCGSPCR